MKYTFILLGALVLCACAGADKTEPLPPTARHFAIPEDSSVTVTPEDIAASSNNGLCVRCRFSEEDQAIDALIGEEIEVQQAAFEQFIKEGMSEEEAAERVYVKKEYKRENPKVQKPTRYMK